MGGMVMILLAVTVALFVTSVHGECQRRVCNVYNNYDPLADYQIKLEEINVSLCSHINYNSAILDNEVITPIHDKNPNTARLVEYKEFMKLKEQKPDLKILITLNAYICAVDPFRKMVLDYYRRKIFINQVLSFLENHDFDGFNLHCVFLSSGNSDVRDAMSSLFSELRHAFDKETSKKYLLTLDVFGEQIYNETSYDIEYLTKNVDWINMHAVDLHGHWYNTTGHHSPLCDNYKESQYSIQRAVEIWIARRAPREKLVIGLPAYGKGYTLTTDNAGDSAPAAEGAVVPETGYNGFLTYTQICMLSFYNTTRFRYFPTTKTPVLLYGDQWVGYDDVYSLQNKIRFIKKQGLGGFNFMNLEFDDFAGVCKRGVFPLLSAVNNECDK